MFLFTRSFFPRITASVFLFSALLTSAALHAQIGGERQIPSANYPNLAVAIDSLNTQGVASGGITFTLAGDQVYAHSAALVLTATGSAASPIIFAWDGLGERPILNFSGTTADSEAGIVLQGSDYVTLDGLDIRNPDGLLEYGILLVNASATNGAHYNLVRNTAVSLNKTNPNQTIGIHVLAQTPPADAGGAMTHNHFINNQISNAAFGYNFEGTTSDVSLMSHGNLVGGEEGGESIIDDIVFCGVYLRNQNGAVVHNTTISNMVRIGDGNTAPAAISTTSGLPSGDLDNPFEIYNNRIVDAHSGFTSIFGMYLNARRSDHFIFNNVLDNITATGGGNNTSTGIMVFGTDINAYIYNNMLSRIAAPASALATAPVSRGIEVRTFGSAYIYYNSVRLEYQAEHPQHHSAAFYLNNANNPVDLRNNIFVNLASPAEEATAYIAAFFKSTNNFSNLAATTNNNLYWAAEDSPQQLLFYGHNSSAPLMAQTIEAYQAAAATVDQQSFAENVPFLADNDLHIDPLAVTQVRGNAAPVLSPIVVDTDINGMPRDTETPDIGAQELPEAYPLAAQNPWPADGAGLVPVGIEHLQWAFFPAQTHIDPAGFHVKLATDPAFEELLTQQWFEYVEGETAYEMLLPETPVLDYGTTYYWIVIPSADQDLGPQTPEPQTWSFSTEELSFDYPLAAMNPQPADGAVDVPATVALQWEYHHEEAYALPAGFHVYFGDQHELGGAGYLGWVAYESGQSVYEISPVEPGGDNLPYESQWFWKVVPTADEEFGPEALEPVVWSFTVEEDPFVSAGTTESPRLSVYPNPMHETLFVESPGEGQASLYNMLGRMVMQQPLQTGENRFETGHLPAGIYLIRIETEDQLHTLKIQRR